MRQGFTACPAIDQALHVAAQGFGQALVRKARQSQHAAIGGAEFAIKLRGFADLAITAPICWFIDSHDLPALPSVIFRSVPYCD